MTDVRNLSDAVPGRFAAAARCGDPQAEYEQATSGCAMIRRADRSLLRIWGRAPRRMLNGMLTNRLPDPPAEEAGLLAGERTYGTILTRKARIVSDARAFWMGRSEDDGIVLDVASAAWDGVLRHFATYLPPRLARAEDLSGKTGLLTVVGDHAGAAVRAVFGGDPGENRYWLLGAGPMEDGAVVARGLEQAPSWDVWAGEGEMERIAGRLEREGAVPAGSRTWEILRVEAGFPAVGADMDESVIPIEAGLADRAFDHGKGCYTGQEVVVRVLHRGRVNWRLRALRLGDSEAAPGDALFLEAGEKAVGRVTSCVRSPRFGEWIAMGYVRREVEPPAALRLGSAGGPEVAVARLAPERA